MGDNRPETTILGDTKMNKIKVAALASEFKMDVNDMKSKLMSKGFTVKRRDSSVDADAARKALGKVISLDKVRQRKAGKMKVGTKEWYAKYPHVVKDSVRDPTAKDRKLLGSRCHGKVCTIKCVDTGKERVINTQDAFQVKRTVEAQKLHNKERRRERRASRKLRKTQKA